MPQAVSCFALMMFCSSLGLDPPLIHRNFLFYQPCPPTSRENHCSTAAKVPHFSVTASLLFGLQVNWVFSATQDWRWKPCRSPPQHTHTHTHVHNGCSSYTENLINTQIQTGDYFHEVWDLKVKQTCIPVTVFVWSAVITDTHTHTDL